jgi:hypothetical protein
MTAMLNFRRLPLLRSPFPHVCAHDYLPPGLYRQLSDSFPTCPAASGPTGFSCFRGDPAYEALIVSNEAWSWLYRSCQSESFVCWALQQFATVWAAGGCLIGTERAHYVDYCESRHDKERRYLERVLHEPEALWVRLDLLQSHVGYHRAAHRDHQRRLVTMLIYFCDARENEMCGGSLRLHGQSEGSIAQDQTFVPEHNLMVAFPRLPESFHSVDTISRQRRPRNFIQITVSSSTDAWTS